MTNGLISRFEHADVVVLIVRLLVGIVFLWAGLLKLQYPLEFLDAVYQYRVLGPTSGFILTIILPATEVLIGMSLILNIWSGGGFIISSLLAFTFICVQLMVIVRGDSVDCGCFGNSLGSDSTIGWWTLGRTVLLAVIAVIGYVAWTMSVTYPRNGVKR